MRGRWASMAIGAGIARHRAGAEVDQERQAYESQLSQSQRQIEAQQRQLESLQGQTQQKPRQEDPTKKLEKYADLRQKGLLTEEEFQKLKADLLSQM
jgi:multidrug resistance efflux pump